MVRFSSSYRTWYIMTNCTRFQYLDYVRTTYRKAFRADSKCASGILWTVTAQNWNKSFTNIKHRAGAVGREGLVNWIFPSISVGPSPLSYLFTSATARIPVHTAPKWGTELIRYAPRSRSAGAASLRYSTETAPKISGGSRGGARGPAPLIFRPNWGPKGRKKFFWRLRPPSLT